MRGRWLRMIVLSLLASAAHAQQRPDDVHAPVHVDTEQLVRGYLRAGARRNVGIALASAGVALAILGGVVIGYGVGDREQLSAGVELGAGIISSTVGVALAIPGIVLWVTG